jgi:predicted membrane-bound spermidine synthase
MRRGKDREKALSQEDSPLNRKTSWILLSAIFLASFSLIAFEITLSRFLSVLLSYHYVSFILSLALLGLGLGGMFIHMIRPQIPRGEKRFRVLTLWASLFSISIPVSILLITEVGYIQEIPLAISFYGFLLLIPFFFAGVLLAEIYRIFPVISGNVYGLDLMGAATGSLGSILFLNTFGGIHTNFVLGGVASLAAVLLAMGKMGKGYKEWFLSVICFLISLTLVGVTLMGVYHPDLPIGKDSAKEIHEALFPFEGKIAETRWSAFGRTDLVKYNRFPDHMDIYIDGTAGSSMYRFNGDINQPGPAVHHLQDSFPGYFPFLHLREEEKNNALIIGPGGGRDILLSLMAGVQEITAVEVNKDLVNIVFKYSEFNGGIYKDFEKVKIVVDEGRNFIKRQRESYDIIFLSLPVTNTSRSLEGYSLTENFLFTTEAIQDYLNHLTEEGRLIVVGHNDAEILRLLSISLTALRRKGTDHTQGMTQTYIVSSGEYLVFVLKKKAFTPEGIFRAYQAMIQMGFDPQSSYFPYIRKLGVLNPALIALEAGKISLSELEKRVGDGGYDVRAVTDNRPFFYKLEIGIPKTISMALWSSMFLLLLMTTIPLIFTRRRPITQKETTEFKTNPIPVVIKPVLLFSMLGMSFMMMEISLTQRFMLLLGQPVVSLATLLFSLLGGAGIGSIWSGRVGLEKLVKGISKTSLGITLVIICYAFLLPLIFDQLLGLDLIYRLILSIFLCAMLGFLMGVPFPLGIRWLRESGMESCIPWMWGINGVSSVFGSVVSIVIAICLGFTEALLICAGCYFLLFLVFYKS